MGARRLIAALVCATQTGVRAVWRCNPTNQTTVALANQTLPPLRLATCITGLAVSGRRDATNSADPSTVPDSGHDKRRGAGIIDPDMHGPLRAWSDALLDRHITNEFFLQLDLRSELKSRRQGSAGWYVNFSDASELARLGMSAKGFAAQPECNVSGPQRPLDVLTPAILALKPVSVKTTPLPCYCADPARACACADRWRPNWWEQQIKVRACFRDVQHHERHELKRKYDFVLRLRSDYSVVQNGLTAAAMAATMHKSIFGTPRISAFPFGLDGCYMNIDWAWMAPRRLAAHAFDVVQADCEWHACIMATGFPCGGPDSLLTAWWMSHGIPFDAMLTETPAKARGLLNNLGCAYFSQKLGLISRNEREQTPTSSGQPQFGPSHTAASKCPRSAHATWD